MRRLMTTGAVAVAGAAVLTGCVAEVPAPVTSAPPMTEAAALLEPQSTQIIDETLAELAAADRAGDADLLSARVGGDAKTLREIEYTLAEAEDGAEPVAIPSTMQAVYVSGADIWPRTLVSVTEQASEDVTPVVLLWVQDSIDAEYQLRGWAHMIPGATLPAMPGTSSGAAQLEMTTDTLDPTPEAVLTDYAELLRQGEGSDLAASFGADSYRERLFAARETLTEAAEDSDGEYRDAVSADLVGSYVMGTADGGALVFTPLTITSSFTVEDATVSIPDEDEPLLEGELDDTVTHEYLDMIVMYLPGPDVDALPAVVAAEHTLINVSDS
ncbi:hypothetical protein [Demequina aestuarii]|uniref:hypothetical protein n=1 Tax=Demequina aestuarii TaxID=327095 RepID=UPI000A8A8A21|nr:hypothetical protein [Demequina aestuarii]